MRPLWVIFMLATVLILLPDGDSFWRFNALELFASIAIVVGTVWQIQRAYSERRRRKNLIEFPYDKWTAIRDEGASYLTVTMVSEVFLPFHSIRCWGEVLVDKRRVPVAKHEAHQAMTQRGRWTVEEKVALANVPIFMNTVELRLAVVLDDALTKKSRFQTVNIERRP